jgi:hypothetical protein
VLTRSDPHIGWPVLVPWMCPVGRVSKALHVARTGWANVTEEAPVHEGLITVLSARPAVRAIQSRLLEGVA